MPLKQFALVFSGDSMTSLQQHSKVVESAEPLQCNFVPIAHILFFSTAVINKVNEAHPFSAFVKTWVCRGEEIILNSNWSSNHYELFIFT